MADGRGSAESARSANSLPTRSVHSETLPGRQSVQAACFERRKVLTTMHMISRISGISSLSCLSCASLFQFCRGASRDISMDALRSDVPGQAGCDASWTSRAIRWSGHESLLRSSTCNPACAMAFKTAPQRTGGLGARCLRLQGDLRAWHDLGVLRAHRRRGGVDRWPALGGPGLRQWEPRRQAGGPLRRAARESGGHDSAAFGDPGDRHQCDGGLNDGALEGLRYAAA